MYDRFIRDTFGKRNIAEIKYSDAFEMIWEEQKENGWTDAEIDGMTGFVKEKPT